MAAAEEEARQKALKALLKPAEDGGGYALDAAQREALEEPGTPGQGARRGSTRRINAVSLLEQAEAQAWAQASVLASVLASLLVL